MQTKKQYKKWLKNQLLNYDKEDIFIFFSQKVSVLSNVMMQYKYRYDNKNKFEGWLY